jgi:hypothetical protein
MSTRNLDVCAVLLLGCAGMFAREICEWFWNKRFWSPEHQRLQDVTDWWQERAR